MAQPIRAFPESEREELRLVQAGEGPAPHVYHPGIALAVIVTCQLMVVLDSTVVNIALPNIQRSLHFSTTDLSWVLNAYTLVVGGLLLLGGRAGDILGRRRLFIAGIALFTLASLLGGLATTSWALLACRAAQGFGAAFAAPGALALIATNFAEGSARNRALGVFSAVSASGASLGLILGGLLTSWASWRWVMFINVPIGIAVVVLAPLFIQESERHPGHFDLMGACTSSLGMVSLVYGFIRAASDGWDDVTARSAFGLAAVLLVLFVAIELHARQPIVPLRLFADRNRAAAYLNMLLLPATMFGMFFFLTQFLQEVLDFSPIMAGLAFLPLTLGIFTASRIVPRIIPRYGAKPFLVGGGGLILGGMAWLTQVTATSSYLPDVLGPMVLFGIGAGSSFMPLAMTILAGVERHESGAASGLLQTMQQVGGALGVAVLVTVYGISSHDSAGHFRGDVSPMLEAHRIMAHGVASAFSVSAIFAACVLGVALFAIRTQANTPR